MFARRRRQRRLRRIHDGDGSDLPRFRFWQVLTRTLFLLRVREGGATQVYTVDVRYLADDLPSAARGVRSEAPRHAPVSLYRDGLQIHRSNLPASFPVTGGTIDVAVSLYGLTRMHYVRDDGDEHTLAPHPRSLEGLRARFGSRFPIASRVIGAVAVAVLLGGLALLAPQLLEQATSLDLVADRVGTFTSPISLSAEANAAVFVAGLLASCERALTLRNHWLIDLDTAWTAWS